MPHTELFARLMSGEGEFWKRESGPKGDTYYSKQKTKLWKENSKLVDIFFRTRTVHISLPGI